VFDQLVLVFDWVLRAHNNLKRNEKTGINKAVLDEELLIVENIIVPRKTLNLHLYLLQAL